MLAIQNGRKCSVAQVSKVFLAAYSSSTHVYKSSSAVENDSARSTNNLPKPYLKSGVLALNVFNRVDYCKDDYHQHFSVNMNKDGKWPDRWPSIAPFDPYKVPLPVRMGKVQNLCVRPDKFSSLELLKVQNFLHVSPPAVKKHCAALKKFCTPFPKNLKTDEDCEKEFPIEIHTVDYVTASNTPRDSRARTVTAKFRLCHFALNADTRRKFIKLLGNRYDTETDIATVTVNRCPVKKQNKDFFEYVLTALYFESWKKENWETPEYMTETDHFVWENSVSYSNIRDLMERRGKLEEGSVLSDVPEVREYGNALTELKQELMGDAAEQEKIMSKRAIERQRAGNIFQARMNQKRQDKIDSYKKAVIEMLGMPKLEQV